MLHNLNLNKTVRPQHVSCFKVFLINKYHAQLNETKTILGILTVCVSKAPHVNTLQFVLVKFHM